MAKKPNSARPTATATANGEGKKKRSGGVRKVVKKVEYVPAEGATYIPKIEIDGQLVEDTDNPQPLVNADGKYMAVPSDYDPKTHKPLKRGDFADESLWFDLMAGILENKAARMRKKGEEIRKLGGKDRVKAKKLVAALKRFNDLKATLKASGLNVEEILAAMGPDDDETAETAEHDDSEVAQAAE